MSWTAITKEELDALVRKGLEEADDAVLAAWNTMRIEPEKWQCSPEGDIGGGFWALAIRDGVVTWYNDIEDGFNESPFVDHGVIGNYGCNQHDFSTYLMSFDEARKADDWSGEEGTITVPLDLIGAGRITKRQTTYWNILDGRGNAWRVHFRRKVETRFVGSEYSELMITVDHPVLMDHEEHFATLYFTGKPVAQEVTEEELRLEVRRVTEGWRHYEDYRCGADLAGGFGMLAEGPEIVMAAMANVLSRSGVKPSTIIWQQMKRDRLALLLGRNFVIAEAFRFERMDV